MEKNWLGSFSVLLWFVGVFF